jgi:hypothetical protein
MTGKTFFMAWRRPAARVMIKALHDSWPISIIGIEILHIRNALKLVAFEPFQKCFHDSNVDIGMPSK